jgi:metal-responsive CopG/Arc/MetJ family transcriptional regulator
MVRPIKIHEIDEFSDIKSIPDRSITDTIISNIKQLDEEQEMEPLIRQILYDPNETPHGSTEIADILTTHLHIRGEKQLAAFVLKGKSFGTVRSRKVTHQFAKLRQIPELDLMVLGAVDNIHNDAKRDFVQCAQDAGCDYLIINCHDLSRLFIAYDFILRMQEMEPRVQKLYLESGDILHPPPDCEDYDEACQNIFATIDDMFLHYSESGLQTWSRENRDRLMQDSIERFYDELKVIEIEERKIH